MADNAFSGKWGVGKAILGNVIASSEREFMVANGQGGFASMSLNGGPSRKYHALLVASLKPPLDRYVVLHNIEETLNGVPLAAYRQQTDGAELLADGFKYLVSFQQSPFPTFTYAVGGNLLEKQVVPVHGRNAVVIRYRIAVAAAGRVALELAVLLNNRDFHHTGSLRSADAIRTLGCADGLAEYDLGTHLPHGRLTFSGGVYSEVNRLRRDLSYHIDEAHRGENGRDTALHAGNLALTLAEGDSYHLLFSLEPIDASPEALIACERQRLEALQQACGSDDPFVRDLALAADSFVVRRQSTDGMTVLAGYPWFGDWGRDTMIALPGLTLATGRFAAARSILSTFARYCSEGMLPNKFPDYDGEPLMYNTIDASLWYFHAIHKYLQYSGDYDFVKAELWPSMQAIIRYHIAGTRYGIKVDGHDGLLCGGDETTQLTWMDVKFESRAITPRYGKAVEINALWYNALKLMQQLAPRFGENADEYERQAGRVRDSFEPTFWNAGSGCLYDCVTPEGKLGDIRPNQIVAVSLPWPLLPVEKQKAVVDLVAQKLYTPHGLRSLAADDPRFIGVYLGGLRERDYSYHQGTVWSWPLGHFLTAHKKVYRDSAKLNAYLDGIRSHFYQEGCINNISEIFDGLEPNQARGCYAQAWSVGEILRVLTEDMG